MERRKKALCRGEVRGAVAEVRAERDACLHGEIIPVRASLAKRLPAFAGHRGAW
jgi:hypothetical protein